MKPILLISFLTGVTFTKAFCSVIRAYIKLLTTGANKANMFSRITHNQSVIWHIASHDAARTDKTIFSECVATDDSGVCTYGSTLPDQGR